MSFRKVASTSLCAALMSLVAPAMAAPVQYSFSTSSFAVGSSALLALLGQTTVSGSFTYDSAGALYGQSGDLGFEPGFAAYAGPEGVVQSYYGLSGSVAGLQFSDIVGSANVGNNLQGSVSDLFTLNSETTLKVGANTPPSDYARQLIGFTVGAYTLSNVRLYWTGNFLNDSALPATPPTFSGVLALDFVRTDDPTNLANAPYYSNSVFFTGLTVQAAAVPEADTSIMMAVGLGVLGLAARRRQQKRMSV